MIILPLNSSSANLENSGGKGASLARLSRMGLPVPTGFILTTQAYQQFTSTNQLDGVIGNSLENLSSENGGNLENASTRIRAAFSIGRLPEDMRRSILEEYHRLDPDQHGVAVRSSATTEDLPDLSFAGQQDTFLNIQGDESLCRSVVDCWSSLWTARAIGYRMRSRIPHEQAALAVVVQKMVFSDSSGVMFTANPLTGLLTETVIDATFGLGEALVSGQVEPDHFVADSTSGKISSLSLGSKSTTTQIKSGGGVEVHAGLNGQERSLSEAQVKELVATGQKIQTEYGCPQDIEWAFANDQLFILQSRPITSLFPLPKISFDPLVVWFSFGAFQGIVGPMTPLGQEAIQRVVLGVGKKLGVNLSFEEQDILVASAERIWVKISDLIRNPLGTRILSGFLGIGEPGTNAALSQVTSDPRLGAGQGRVRLRTLARVLRFLWPAVKEMPRSILTPEKARHRFDARLEAYLETVRIPPGVDAYQSLANFAAFMSAQGGLADALSVLLPTFAPIIAPSFGALNLIGHLVSPGERNGAISVSVLDVTRALPNNVTTEMDLALWQAAKTIKADQGAEKSFIEMDGSTLASRYLAGDLPVTAQFAIRTFLDQYGMRGVGEIDLGQPRWREDPAPVMESLRSYLQITPDAAPDLVFEKSAHTAEDSIERMAVEVRGTRGGRIKEKILRGAVRRVRVLLGARESPKFTAVRAMDRVRSYLLKVGEAFVVEGIIQKCEDLFFLHVRELVALSNHEVRDWKALIANRRLAFEREDRRKQVPRLLVSDGRTFYDGVVGNGESADAITGSPVSPGVVEGRVRVVFDPRGARLEPGEILVCHGTDPAWTPLFMAAGGLVMEVGGMMTHGSVVAREYGIPAVVGVSQVTERLKDGQLIRVNGSTGEIRII